MYIFTQHASCLSVARIERKIWETESGACRLLKSRMTSWLVCLKKESFNVEKSSAICFYKHPVLRRQYIRRVP